MRIEKNCFYAHNLFDLSKLISTLQPNSLLSPFPDYIINFSQFSGIPGKRQNIKDKKNKNKEKIDRIYYTCIEFAME